MVQVDVFWSYAIGAGFAAAASRQLIREREDNNGSAFANKYFVVALLTLSILFVPSAVCLLWAFPSWETMHVGTYSTIPAWLVTLFCMTNITQGILGYWVTYRCILKRRFSLAGLQVIGAYMCMFFILVNGWDGKGYQRFFSTSKEALATWTWPDVIVWSFSSVALTLYIFGIVLFPVLFYFYCKWFKEGYYISDEVDKKKAARTDPVTIWFLLELGLGAALGWAIAATVLIHWIGRVPGILASLALACLMLVGRWSFGNWLVRQLWLQKAAVFEEKSYPALKDMPRDVLPTLPPGPSYKPDELSG